MLRLRVCLNRARQNGVGGAGSWPPSRWPEDCPGGLWHGPRGHQAEGEGGIEKDPAQKTNLADAHPEQVEQMLAAYASWWEETVPLMVNENAEMSSTQPFHEMFHAQEAAGGIPTWAAPEL